ncbi:hypothetical protein KVR01_001522 [Diaporthe batatas]|uniref:uncharacterized protein n=1 Tax=Diaporthe batatas TaxID=748121 RepID=UPI001D03952F|nr:uncharacterized protein KVR01_001522 [Diaporthe batatas]KAG8168773.1 hypothetical protein KVR01_001522 [Diaporthe batatas]
MSSSSRRWKKALLPTLGSRRKGREPTIRLPTSRTVSDINIDVAVTMMGHNKGPSTTSASDEVDERVVSALLETTSEADAENQPVVASKNRAVTQSQTEGVMPCTEDSSTADSPTRIHLKVTKLSTPPRRSSRRNPQPVARDFSRASPKRSADGLVRPLPKLRSSSHLGRETLQVMKSPPMSSSKQQANRSGRDTIRTNGSHLDKANSPLAPAFAEREDLVRSATDATGLATFPKISRLRKNKVFAKFATAISDHFGKQENRKDAGNGVKESNSVVSNEAIRPILHGPPLDTLTLAQLPLTDIEATSTSADRISDEFCSREHRRGSVPVARAPAALSIPQKRLTMVEGSPPLEDPFSEESPRRQSTEFQARLRTVQAFGAPGGTGPITSLSDPFLTEAIMDTSNNSILKTPPIGSSTPRNQARDQISARAPSKSAQTVPGTIFETAVAHRDSRGTSISRFAATRDSPTKMSNSPERAQRDMSNCSPSKTRGSSDSTRLSSFPPGSTIRHVPRSMGRLHGLPDLAASAARRKSPKVGRKKHPSPSKRDLDLYGKFMEESVSLGVFKDTDELAMSFNSCTVTNSPALTPRDKNSLIRGSNDRYCDSGKSFSPKGPVAGFGNKSRSRIPQPVGQSARSRTETALARDFAPVNHGDSTAKDELQWDSSAYIVGRGRESRCQRCGSTSEAL